MASFIYLQSAKIQNIFDSQTGMELESSEFVGNDEQALKLRTNLRKDIERGEVRYVCPICHQAIYLCSNPGKTGQYFAHRDAENNCPKLEKQNASQDIIRAIKYNGAKESLAHLETKRLLLDCLNADPDFSGAKEEEVWKSKNEDGKFRRPDVQAIYHSPTGDLRIAFEIQLSTTFLSEIVQRSEFYLNEGALLIWVFRRFVEKGPKLTQLDIFYPNNLNAFVIDEKTRDISVEIGQLHLRCHWAEPIINNTDIDQQLREQIIPFKSLTLDQRKQQTYYFDYDTAKQLLGKKIKIKILQSLVNQLKNHCKLRSWGYDDPIIKKLKPLFAEYGYHIPKSTAKFHTLLKSLYSLELGKPIGSGFNHLVEFGHQLYNLSPNDLFFFFAASNAYNRKDELLTHGNTENWKKKKSEVWEDIVGNSSSKFQWNEDYSDFIFLLFPEVKDAFEQLVTQIIKERESKTKSF
jgi:competence CoiA-like predicted nuclease